jgi:hypothetical protein
MRETDDDGDRVLLELLITYGGEGPGGSVEAKLPGLPSMCCGQVFGIAFRRLKESLNVTYEHLKANNGEDVAARFLTGVTLGIEGDGEEEEGGPVEGAKIISYIVKRGDKGGANPTG